MIELTVEQQGAIAAIEAWYKGDKQIFKLFGPAGSGKSFLSYAILETLGVPFVQVVYTGKGAQVLKEKSGHPTHTIHRAIYKCVSPPGRPPTYVFNDKSPLSKVPLTVVDEGGMVGARIVADLKRAANRILVLGDPHQLPPIKDSLSELQKNPDYQLTEIHRQAEGSPILEMATRARNGLHVPTTVNHRDVNYEDYDVVLVGRNNTRKAIIQSERKRQGLPGNRVEVGERLICIRNNHDLGIMNGTMWHVLGVRGEQLLVASEDDAEPITVDYDPKVLFEKITWQKSDHLLNKGAAFFYFSNAITVHKAQGSEWDSVLLVDESFCFRDNARKWLYTGITRAAKHLDIVR